MITENILNRIISESINLVIEEKSGIHIKKKNKGKFNALKKRTGKSTEELTHSKNPLTRKRAIFARMQRSGITKVKKIGNDIPVGSKLQ